MKFNVQRVLTPAYLTSVALVVVGVLLGLAWYPVAAWLFVLLGLALNAMAVSVTEINDAPRAPGTAVRRRPSLTSRGIRADDLEGEPADRVDRRRPDEPETETAATPTVPHTGSSPLKHPPGS
ncbi:MAG: hypothetical protein ACOC84_02595 [Actinomycetota bacterium]